MSEKKGLFGRVFGKKRKSSCCDMDIIEEKDPYYNIESAEETECDCGGACNPDAASDGPVAPAPSTTDAKTVIKVVGTGCAKCNKLTENTTQAGFELGMDIELVKITDMMEIAATGVMQTPGLIVDDKIVVMGKVPSVEELKALLLK